MIYLDNAATTLVKPKAVSFAAKTAIETLASPGRGGHSASIKASDVCFECRERIAKHFSFDYPERVIFTSNATHSLNIAIFSLIKSGDRVLVSGYEHNAVIRPLNAIGAKTEILRTPLFDKNAFLTELKKYKDVSAVVCTHVSNVFGYVLPIIEVSEFCRENNIPLIIDASQSAGIEKLDLSEIKASFTAFPGHKSLFGPQGTGILLCGDDPYPILFGGTGSNSESPFMPESVPDRIEAGTHNMPGIAGLNEGIKFIEKKSEKAIRTHERNLLELFNREVSKIKGAKLYYSDDDSLQTSVISFNIADLSPEDVSYGLSKLNIATRSGLHCAPQAHLTAGTSEKGTVRASFSPFNTESDISKTADALKYISTHI